MIDGSRSEDVEDRGPFELADEPEVDRPADALPSARPAQRPQRSSSGAATQRSGSRASAHGRTRRADDAADWLFDHRRRKRLLTYVPVMLLAYLVVGWLFAGAGLVWFALAGLGVGLFTGWRRRHEILLGSVAAAAGLVASLLAVQRPLLFAMIATGVIGYVAGIDDRLRNP